MTAEERIEALLNRANNTISDLPQDYILGYTPTQCVLYLRRALTACGVDVEEDQDMVTTGNAITASCDFGLHLNDVIERLCWALENTLCRYEKALYRLRSWGDVQYVSDLEEGKV